MPFALLQIQLLQVQLPPENLPYLFAALAVSWAVFFVYAFWISRRQQDLRREIEELRQAMDDD
ncbi:MAG: CcmD family protein [Chloroflexi bacterium]|nr:CcmD family protein [Chloroflexota bacterium]